MAWTVAAATLVVAAQQAAPRDGERAAPVTTDTEFWALSHVVRLDPETTPARAGRDREVLTDLGAVRFAASGDWSFQGIRLRLAFTHDDAARGSVTHSSTPATVTGSWSERAADGRLAVEREDAPPVAYVPDDTGTVLISAREAGDAAGEVRLDALALRSPGTVDARDVAGSYWFGYLETSAFVDGAVGGDAYSAFGELVLKRNGAARLTVVSSDGELGGAGIWEIAGSSAGALAGSVTLTVGLEDGSARTLTLLPGADGNVILGADRDPPDGVAAIVVGVRKGRRLSNRRIRGTLLGVGIEVFPFARSVPLAGGDLTTTLDLEVDDFHVALDFDGSRTLTVHHEPVRLVRRDRRAPRGASARLLPRRRDTTAFYVLARDGLVRALDDGIPLLGAVDPGATFAFVVDDPRDGDDFAGLELVVRPPEGVR